MKNTITVIRKINVEQVVEVNLPVFFKDLSNYYMVLSPKTMLQVKDFNNEIYNGLGLYPCIEQREISEHHLSRVSEIEAITEEQFKEVFTKVSLELEALMN
jgi:hypothetical protein